MSIDSALTRVRDKIRQNARENELGKEIALRWIDILEAKKLCLRPRSGRMVILAEDGRNLTELMDDSYGEVVMEFRLNDKEQGGTGNFHYLTALRLLGSLPGGHAIREGVAYSQIRCVNTRWSLFTAATEYTFSGDVSRQFHGLFRQIYHR